MRFTSVSEQIDTNSPIGKTLFVLIGALAELERTLIRERVIAGLALARQKGKIIGRQRKRNSALIESLLETGMSFRAIAKISGASHGSVSAQKKEWLAKKKLAQQKAEAEGKNSTTTPVESAVPAQVTDATAVQAPTSAPSPASAQ